MQHLANKLTTKFQLHLLFCLAEKNWTKKINKYNQLVAAKIICANVSPRNKKRHSQKKLAGKTLARDNNQV